VARQLGLNGSVRESGPAGSKTATPAQPQQAVLRLRSHHSLISQRRERTQIKRGRLAWTDGTRPPEVNGSTIRMNFCTPTTAMTAGVKRE
jgi:hypothetical protein